MISLDQDQQGELRDDDPMFDQKADEHFGMHVMVGDRYHTMTFGESHDAYDKAMTALIMGEDRGRDDVIEGILEYHALAPNLLMTRLIRSTGARPDVCMAIAIRLQNGTAVFRHENRNIAFIVDRECGYVGDNGKNRFRLDNDVEWTSDGQMILPFPDTIALAAVGRPLRAIVSHPILDPLALTITKAEAAERNGIWILSTDIDDPPLPMESFMAACRAKEPV